MLLEAVCCIASRSGEQNIQSGIPGLRAADGGRRGPLVETGTQTFLMRGMDDVLNATRLSHNL